MMNKEQIIDKAVQNNINNISVGAQEAIIQCALAYRNGGNWGMIKKASERKYEEKLATLHEEKENVKVEKLSNGCLVLCKEEFLTNNINRLVPNAIDSSYKQMKEKRIAEDREKFVKFMGKVAEGKVKSAKKIAHGYELVIGIYSVNKVNTISLNGIDYPAYKVTAPEVVGWLARQFPHRTAIRTITKGGQQVFEQAENILRDGVKQKAMYKGLEISDTGTGIFLTFKIMA